jgi:AcrR family transcriptional regulator
MSSRKLPQPRGTKRLRTRERLLDAATDLFRARGISAVSLDEIAARAGVTKGAIYGSFANKDALVFEVANGRIERGLIAFDAVTPVREQLRRIVRQVLGGNAAQHFRFFSELDHYAQARHDLGMRFIAAARERHAASAANLERFADELALPPLQFAVAVQALMRGLLFQQASFPETVSEQTTLAALERLLK